MPTTALLLVLLAAASHCAWNLVLKSETHRVEISLGALVVGVALAAPVLLVYPVSAVSAEAWGLIALSGLFETAYMLLLAAAYQAGDLSLVYPIARGTPGLLIVPASILLLGESLSGTGMLGIALVVLGIFGAHLPAGHGAAGSMRAVGLALLTGVAIASYSLVNKLGVQRVPVPLYAVLVFAVDAVMLAIVMRLQGKLTWPPLPPGRWKPALVVGVLMMGSYLGVLGAMSLAPLAYVIAAREVSIVMTTLAGILLLGERATWRRLAGAACIFAGLVSSALSR